jgi:hypothetical protein
MLRPVDVGQKSPLANEVVRNPYSQILQILLCRAGCPRLTRLQSPDAETLGVGRRGRQGGQAQRPGGMTASPLPTPRRGNLLIRLAASGGCRSAALPPSMRPGWPAGLSPVPLDR